MSVPNIASSSGEIVSVPSCFVKFPNLLLCYTKDFSRVIYFSQRWLSAGLTLLPGNSRRRTCVSTAILNALISFFIPLYIPVIPFLCGSEGVSFHIWKNPYTPSTTSQRWTVRCQHIKNVNMFSFHNECTHSLWQLPLKSPAGRENGKAVISKLRRWAKVCGHN